MSDLLNRLPERAVEQSIREAQMQSMELKATQRLGSASVLTARVFTSAQQDVTLVGPSGYSIDLIHLNLTLW